MEHKDHKNICIESIDAVRAVGRYLLSEINLLKQEQIETKSLNSLVSYVDQAAERMLVAELSRITPDAAFLTEEKTVETNSAARQVWIIDPLDGTNNYIHRIPHYAISIALVKDEKPQIGIIYEPNSNEMYHAIAGSGAYLNNALISVSSTKNLSQAMIATGFPYNIEAANYNIAPLQSLMHSARGIRRMGSAALDLAYVACGRYDAYYESHLNPWDIAAGVLLVQEAGGIVTDYSNRPSDLSGRQVLASNGNVHGELVSILA